MVKAKRKGDTKRQALNKLATKYVGDDQKPNLVFVTVDGFSVAVFINDTAAAIEYAKRIDSNDTPISVEDNSGIVWDNPVAVAEQMQDD